MDRLEEADTVGKFYNLVFSAALVKTEFRPPAQETGLKVFMKDVINVFSARPRLTKTSIN